MKKEKKYLTPVANVVIFQHEDIITDSLGNGDDTSIAPYVPHGIDDPDLE